MSIEEEFGITEDPTNNKIREYYTYYLDKNKQLSDACNSINRFLKGRHKPDRDDVDFVREALQNALDLLEGEVYPALEIGIDIHKDWGKYINELEEWGEGWKAKAIELLEKHEPETLALLALKKEK